MYITEGRKRVSLERHCHFEEGLNVGGPLKARVYGKGTVIVHLMHFCAVCVLSLAEITLLIKIKLFKNQHGSFVVTRKCLHDLMMSVTVLL